MASKSIASNKIHDLPGHAFESMLSAWGFYESNPEIFNQSNGVLVLDVVEGGQAAQVGLNNGDIILAYDGQYLRTTDQLIDLITEKEQDEFVQLVYLKGS